MCTRTRAAEKRTKHAILTLRRDALLPRSFFSFVFSLSFFCARHCCSFRSQVEMAQQPRRGEPKHERKIQPQSACRAGKTPRVQHSTVHTHARVESQENARTTHQERANEAENTMAQICTKSDGATKKRGDNENQCVYACINHCLHAFLNSSIVVSIFPMDRFSLALSVSFTRIHSQSSPHSLHTLSH